jgi:hypothetical protein
MPEIDAERTTSYAAFVRQVERPVTAGSSDALRRVLLKPGRAAVDGTLTIANISKRSGLSMSFPTLAIYLKKISLLSK